MAIIPIGQTSQEFKTTNYVTPNEGEKVRKFVLKFGQALVTDYQWDGSEVTNQGSIFPQAITIDNSFGPFDLIFLWGRQAQYKIGIKAGHIKTFPIPALLEPFFDLSVPPQVGSQVGNWTALVYLHNYPLPPEDYEPYCNYIRSAIVIQGAGLVTTLFPAPPGRWKYRNARLTFNNQVEFVVGGSAIFEVIDDQGNNYDSVVMNIQNAANPGALEMTVSGENPTISLQPQAKLEMVISPNTITFGNANPVFSAEIALMPG